MDEEENEYEAKENFLDFSHHKVSVAFIKRHSSNPQKFQKSYLNNDHIFQDDDEDEEENGAREEEEQDEVVELEQKEGRGEEEVENEERENEDEVAEHLTISPNEQNDRRSKRAKSAVRVRSFFLTILLLLCGEYFRINSKIFAAQSPGLAAIA